MTASTGVIAIDVGGTAVKGALVTRDAPTVPVGRAEHVTGSGDAEKSLQAVVDCIRDVDAYAKENGVNVEGCGVATAGPLDLDCSITTKPQLGWYDFPLRDRLLRALGGMDVVIDNDANAAALGCWLHTAGTGRSLLLVTVSTGIGGGFVDERGLIFHGSMGGAGEIGHLLFGEHECEYDHEGPCLEGSASGSGIRKRFGIEPKDADRELRMLIADEVGRGLVAPALLYEPASIVFMGSVAIGYQRADERQGIKQGERFLDIVRSRIMKSTATHADIPISLTPFGTDTGIIGAAALVLTQK